MKQSTVPAEDATIEGELWAGDQSNTKHEERAVRELYRRRLRIAELEDAARVVLDTFRKDEAQGFRSRDRQFAIDILGRVLPKSYDQ